MIWHQGKAFTEEFLSLLVVFARELRVAKIMVGHTYPHKGTPDNYVHHELVKVSAYDPPESSERLT